MNFKRITEIFSPLGAFLVLPEYLVELFAFYDFVIPNPDSYENSTFETLTIPRDIMNEITSKTVVNT